MRFRATPEARRPEGEQMGAHEFGKVGRYCDGRSDYILIPMAIDGATSSLEGWFVWIGGEGSLLRDATSDGGWSLGHDDGGHLAYRAAGIDRVTSVPVETLRDGWHHYAVTKDEQHVAYYLDGEKVDEWDGAPNDGGRGPWTTMHDAPSNTYVEGFVAQITFFDYALMAEEVKGHREAGPTA